MAGAGDLGWIGASGAARDVGIALGRAGRAAMAPILRHPLWAEANDPRHATAVARMARSVQQRHPAIWAEIEGLAEGLALPLAQVFAWNCRGDILTRGAEGCTSVWIPGAAPVLAHNEDGFPFLRGACFLAAIAPQDGPGLTSFCYPGSIPGHTFAISQAGFVQTVNNIRLDGLEPDIPRMVLGRAMLMQTSVAGAISVLDQGAQSGGFHMALADARGIVSVEFGGGAVSVQRATGPGAHANHALHLEPCPEGQRITGSSRDRQLRAELLLSQGRDPLAILQDRGGPGLPIRRDDPDDPDEENTLATLVACCTGAGAGWTIDWQVHDRPGQAAAHSGAVRNGRA